MDRPVGLTPPLPQPISADAQMSGALVAYTLLRGPDPPDSVVILEARETCSGATGR